MSTNKRVGVMMKAWRSEASLTQSDLAEKLERSQAWVSSVERGDHAITMDALDMWADACSVSVDVVRTDKGTIAELVGLYSLIEDEEEANRPYLLYRLRTMDPHRRGLIRDLILNQHKVPKVMLDATVMSWEMLSEPS